jgi:membrane protein implicated in regulation of membrane protease activity
MSMVNWKEDLKKAGIAVVFDFMVIGLIMIWVAAIILALLEISLWVVFGLFLIGCILLFTIRYFFDEKEEPENGEEQKEQAEQVEKE